MNQCGIALGIVLASVFELEGLCFAHATSPELLRDEPSRSPSNDRRDAGEADDHARDRMCHISRHPRDGIGPERHPCPPVVAATALTLRGHG